MKKALSLLTLIFLLVLTSCASRTETLALASNVGVEIYSWNRKEASLIILDEETMKILVGANGRDVKGIVESVYGGKVYYVEDGAFEEREQFYDTLKKEAGVPSILELWAEEGKMLEDTQLVSYLKGKTFGFEEELAERIKKGSSSYGVYRASDVLGENCDYETAIIFLKRWIKAIIG